MIVHVSKKLVEKIIQDETIVYAQIPLVRHNPYDYYNIFSEPEHLLPLEIDKEQGGNKSSYSEGYYPFYRHKDLKTFEKLLNA